MCGVIYCITCLLNGMKYVGQTTQLLEERMKQHKYRDGLYIDQEIQRLGWEGNFSCEVLEVCPVEKLNEREIFWIAKLNSKYPNGYNLTSGGSGFNGRKHTPESIALMSDIAKIIWERRSPEERAAIARKREANRSPEERSATARARELAKSPEERSARAKACAARRTPEERSAIVKKAWVTRRANESKKTLEERVASKKSKEELSAIAKKASAKVNKPARNAKISATWRAKTPEEIASIAAKRWATIQAKKKQQLIERLIELLKNIF